MTEVNKTLITDLNSFIQEVGAVRTKALAYSAEFNDTTVEKAVDIAIGGVLNLLDQENMTLTTNEDIQGKVTKTTIITGGPVSLADAYFNSINN